MIYTDVSETERRIISARRAEGHERKHTGKGLAKPRAATDWKRARALTDRDIRRGIEVDPEAHPTDVNFWKNAKVILPRPKQTVTIRLDADLVDWLRLQKGYQTRINAVLRTYTEAQRP